MKKLIIILFLFLSVLGFSQQNITIGKGKLEGMLYNTKSGAIDTIIALHRDSLGQFKFMNAADPVNPLDVVNLRTLMLNSGGGLNWDSIFADHDKYMIKSLYDPDLIEEQLVGVDAYQTLVNKTLISPVIANFTNAIHNHTTNATGGTLSTDNIIQGIVNLYSQWTKTGANIYRNSNVGIGTNSPQYSLDVAGTTQTGIAKITNSIQFDGLTVTDIVSGTSDNDKMVTKGYVDDAITAGGSYTNEMAQDAVGSILDNDTIGDIDFVYDDGTPKISATVQNDSHNHTSGTISGLTTADFTTDSISQWNNDAGYVANTYTLTGDLGGTLNNPSVDDDSHNHVISNIDNLSTITTRTNNHVTNDLDTLSTNEIQSLQQVTDIGNTVNKTTTAVSDSTYIWRNSLTQTSGSATNKLYGFKNYVTYSGTQSQGNMAGFSTYVNNIGTGTVAAVGGTPVTIKTGTTSNSTHIYPLPITVNNYGKFNKIAGHGSWIYNYNRDAANNDIYGTVNSFWNYGFHDSYSGFQVDAWNYGKMNYLDGVLIGMHAGDADSTGTLTGINFGNSESHAWTGSPRKSVVISVHESTNRGLDSSYVILSKSTAPSYFAGNMQITPLAGTGNRLVTATSPGVLAATVTDNSTNWNTAYGWGNHASANYLKLDQTTPQQIINGIPTMDAELADFTASNQLVNKEYVDQAISFASDFYFNNTADALGGIYYKMLETITGEAESTFSSAALSAGDNQALFNFITAAGVPGVTTLNNGIYAVHVHASMVTAGGKTAKIYFTISTCDAAGGTQVLRATSEISGFITTKADIDLHATIPADIAIAATDRIIIKFFANIGNTGNNSVVNLFAEGTTSAHLSIPTSSEVLSSVFVRQDGTKPLTANWDAGSFKITAETLASDVATGTAPLTVASTTVVTNLNADLLDGQHGSYYQTTANMVNATSRNASKYPTWPAAKAYVDSVKTTIVSGVTYSLLTGYVTLRNINVDLVGYTPANNSILYFVPDANIISGDTITLSVNGGTQYPIFQKLDCVDTLAMQVMFYNNQWFVIGRTGSDYVVAGSNTGDVSSVTYDSDTLHIYQGSTEFKVKISTASNNIIVQSLSGTAPTFNVTNGLNAIITLTGTTVMTITNALAGTSGNITIEVGATPRSIEFDGYTFDIAPVLEDAAGVISFAANTHNKLSWYYDGTTITINGTKAYNRY